MPPERLPNIDPATGQVVADAAGDANAGGAGAPASDDSGGTPQNENGGAGAGNDGSTGDGGAAGGEGGGTEVVDFSVDAIIKTKDGFVWKVDPDDPKSMVYKGRTLQELFQNAAKGIKEKDTYISELKAARPKLTDRVTRLPQEDEEAVEFPQFGQVLVAEAQKFGIQDVAMLGWGDAEWDKYAEEHGDRAARRLEDRVNQVKASAKGTYDRENAIALNNYGLREETSVVQDLLDAAGIAADDPAFDYDAILRKVFGDKSNTLPNGVLKNGRIVAEAAKVINTLAVKRAKESGKVQTEEEIAAERENKNARLRNRGVPAGGPGGKRADQHQQKPAKSMAEALARAKAQFLKP